MKTIITKRSLLFYASAFFIAAGCSKDDTDPSAEPVSLIKTVTITSGSGTPLTNSYQYENGKVKTVNYANGNTVNWRHYADSAVQTGVNATGQFLYKAVAVFNAKGYTQTLSQYDVNDNITYQDNNEYNSDNLRVKTTVTTLPYSAVYNYYYTGSRTDSVVYAVNGKPFFRSITTETAADLTNTIGSANYGSPFTGNSTQLMRKFTRYSYNSSGVLLETILYSYTYETNAKGQITKQTETGVSSISGSTTTVYEFTYY